MSEREAIKSLKEFAYTIHGTLSAKEAKIVLNLIEKLQKENEEKTTILLAGAEKVKQLEKENKELKADNYELNNRITDLLENIPIQKVKDKIEEIDKKIKREENEKVVIYLHKQRKILQELLEGRE